MRKATKPGGHVGGCSSSARRRAARSAAAQAADNLVSRLRAEYELLEGKFNELVSAIGLGGGESWKLVGRLLAVAPALRALLDGERPEPLQALRRNCALHAAADLDFISAGAACLRAAEKGPRLGVDAARTATRHARLQIPKLNL